MTSKSNPPRRGEIWYANAGGKRHAMVIVSLDQRNASDRVGSVLAVPFGSFGAAGPTSLQMEPGETGLSGPSFLKAHFMIVIDKSLLIERLPRALSEKRLRQIVAMVNRAIDPDAPYEG